MLDHRDLNVLTHSFPTRRSSDLGKPSMACSQGQGAFQHGLAVTLKWRLAAGYPALFALFSCILILAPRAPLTMKKLTAVFLVSATTLLTACGPDRKSTRLNSSH